MPNIRIPIAVCSAVGEMLFGSHATLDALFKAAGATGDPPDLPHHSKWKTWLFRAGNDPTVDSLAVLGQLIEEFMDLPPDRSSPDYSDWQSKSKRLHNLLEEHGFRYSQGGRVTLIKKPHPDNLDLLDSKFWVVGHFRLFLSHLSLIKEKTAGLQNALYPYGIAAFVAHEDIQPTQEWQLEIEKALFTMDALAAILTPGFKDSNWTDHEVGVAIGRDVLVIPIRRGLDPYGLIGRYQGIQGNGKTIRQVAQALFSALARNAKTKERILDVLVDLFLFGNTDDEAVRRLALIRTVDNIPTKHLDRLRNNTVNNSVLMGSPQITNELNELLARNGIDPLPKDEPRDHVIDDGIPF